MAQNSRITENVEDWIEHMEFPQIPDTFSNLSSPWRVSSHVTQAETINKLLEHSLIVQSSALDFSWQLQEGILGDYVCTMDKFCIEISGLLQYYFSWLDVDAKVFCGTMMRSIKDLGKFHTFLEIEDEIIDNTYV